MAAAAQFAIAHEFGHRVVHRIGQQARFFRKAGVEEEDEPATTRPPLPVTEQEANAFAAALLRPAWLARQQYKHCRGDFERLCKAFAESGAAMGRRLHAISDELRLCSRIGR